MTLGRIYYWVVSCYVLLLAGCQPASRPPQIPTPVKKELDLSSFYTRYAPTQIDILPLTELVESGSVQRTQLNLYVSLLDAFGSQIKSPGIFRIELYEHVQRSADPKGKRIAIWQDIDLTDPVTNNDYWNDFLRTYRFDLPLEQAGNQNYILQITCLCPNGSRLVSHFTLKSQK
ncbi:MAG: hypothetical protein JXM79_13470 [Sedimentisphaerales bacterium]|nr:hypothetical protein [Sedimentisphaerales bacterium]